MQIDEPDRISGAALLERGKQVVASAPGTCGFAWIEDRPILLSAPHAVMHTRDGQPKQEEPGTELLAAGVATALGVSAIWSTDALVGDPNWDDEHAYKSQAAGLVQAGYALDLHVMADRGFDVCLGLGEHHPRDRGLWTLCADEFLAAGYTVSINHPFRAGPRTVTSHLQRSGAQAVQIEMTWDACRADGNGPATAEILWRICRQLG